MAVMRMAQVRRLLHSQLAVSPEVAAIALGVGKVAVDGAIERGAIPTVNLGEGARKRPIPTAWLREQLRIDGETVKAT
jgi:hypothetical protein